MNLAQAQINDISTFAELQQATLYQQTRLRGIKKPSLAIKYTRNLLGKYKRLGQATCQNEQIKLVLDKQRKNLDRLIDLIGQRSEDIHFVRQDIYREVSDNLSIGKLAVQEADLAKREQDKEHNTQLHRNSPSPSPSPTFQT